MKKVLEYLGGRKFIAYLIFVAIFIFNQKIDGQDLVVVTAIYMGSNAFQKKYTKPSGDLNE